MQVELRHPISCFIKLISEEICSAKFSPTPHVICYDKISLAELGCYTRFDPGWHGWRVKSSVLRTEAASDSCCNGNRFHFVDNGHPDQTNFQKIHDDSDHKFQNFVFSPP